MGPFHIDISSRIARCLAVSNMTPLLSAEGSLVFWHLHTCQSEGIMGRFNMGFLNGGNQYSHEDARQVICSCCGIKTSKKKKMNENEEALVRKFCLGGYLPLRWHLLEAYFSLNLFVLAHIIPY